MSTRKPNIILGLLTFGPPSSEEYGTRISSLTTFNDCLTYFHSQGYKHLDTARTYTNGLQESHTARSNYASLGLTISTKWYPYHPGDHHPTNLRANLERSLSELGVPSVEIFYLHAPDRSVDFKSTLRACDELYREGKFRRLGLSNYAAWEVATLCTLAQENNWVRPSVYQAMYNALTRAVEEELVLCCRKFGLSIYAYNALAGGVLSGKYTSSKTTPTDGGRFSDTDKVVGEMYRRRYFRDANFEALKLIQPVVEREGLRLAEVALRWCVHHSKLDVFGGGGDADGIVIGVSSLEQLEGNLRDLEKGPLPEACVRALEEAWVGCTKGDCELYWR